MGVLRNAWIRSEILHTFTTQLPGNPLKRAVLVGGVGRVDDVLEDFKAFFGPNTEVQVTDAGGLADLKTSTQDLVFLYKFDAERNEAVLKLLEESLRVLKPNGAAILYEDMDLLPTKAIADLSTLFDSYSTSVAEGENRSFKVYCMNQFEEETSAKLGLYWILEAYEGQDGLIDENNEKMTRSFLDKTQYTEENIEAYEWIFGKDFISPGGIDENRRVISNFDEMEEGKRMLDVGCGIGGGPRQVARELGMQVVGCDISANMIAFALDRSRKAAPDRRVRYQLADAVEYRFPRESFDYVFSRDCVQHISDLQRLFQNVYECLKPGGQLLITMYGRGRGTLTKEFLQYVKDRKYDLRSLDEVIQIAKNAGFPQVEGENMTPRFEEILRKERQKAIDRRDEFMERFPEKKYEQLLAGWEQKLGFIRDDNHNWLKIKCIK